MWVELIAKISGQTPNPLWIEKLPFIIQGIFSVAGLLVLIGVVYWYGFRKEPGNSALFAWVIGGLLGIVGAKYAIYHFAQGYLPDRWLMYALPSPRVGSLFFLVISVLLAGGYWRYRARIHGWSERAFLLTLIVFMALFSFSVAGIREGVKSIIDPLTRSYWEYTGTLPLVHSVGVVPFLKQYTEILPTLPVHTQTHPPGYVLFLYAGERFFQFTYLGLAGLIISFGALSLWPLYFFWKKQYSEKIARNLTELCMVVPSVIIFSGTSLEIFFLFLMSVTLYSVYRGWQESMLWSVVAGVSMAAALFSNFLFLLTGPLWLGYSIFLLKKNSDKGARKIIAARVLVSGMVMTSVLLGVYVVTEYSIVHNFLAARALNQEIVDSNFASVGTYVNFMIMNAVAFGIYLGLPFVYQLIRDRRSIFNTQDIWHWLGAGALVFFLIIGIFQGENERIWVFLVPLMMGFLVTMVTRTSEKTKQAFLLLQMWQIIMIQILFYTYW